MPVIRPLTALGGAALMLALGCQSGQVRASESKPASTPAPVASATSAEGKPATAASPFDKPGFVTGVKDGRLWVFAAGTQEAQDFAAGKTPAKQVVRPGAGPGGMTIRSSDMPTILVYLATRPGFVVVEKDERLWIFAEGSPALAAYQDKKSFPAKQVVRPGAGPLGITLRSPDAEVLDLWAVTKPGWIVGIKDGHLWVFPEGSKEGADFQASGKTPAKQVIRPGAGPNRMTVRAAEAEHIMAYAAAQEGFITGIKDERLWVFPAGSKEGADFQASGKTPAKQVVRPGAGPMGMTIRAMEAEHIDAYRRAARLQ